MEESKKLLAGVNSLDQIFEYCFLNSQNAFLISNCNFILSVGAQAVCNDEESKRFYELYSEFKKGQLPTQNYFSE